MAFARFLPRRIPRYMQQLVGPSISVVTKKSPPLAIPMTRGISQETMEEERAKQISWFTWITEPLIKAMNPVEKVVTPEESKEREELLSRIQSLYYKKPPEEPGIEFYVEAFDLLIKYDDNIGVEGLWTLAESEGVIFDDDTIDKIEEYLLEVRERGWYE